MDKQVLIAILSLAGIVAGVVGRVWVAKIWARGTENAAKYSNPNYRPEWAASHGSQGGATTKSGCGWVWWAVIGFFGFVFVTNLNQPNPVPQPQMGWHCCDQFGVRCQLPFPQPIGSPCNCAHVGLVGSGYVCP